MADWIEHTLGFPARLFVTVAPLAPFGPGTYRWLGDDLVDRVAVRARVAPREVGLLGFTQRNQRGGLHAHELVGGPDELLGIRRVELARECEAEWERVQPWRLDYPVRQRVRVDVRAIRERSAHSVLAYCVRYAGRECEGDMFEAGSGLGMWARAGSGSDTAQPRFALAQP